MSVSYIYIYYLYIYISIPTSPLPTCLSISHFLSLSISLSHSLISQSTLTSLLAPVSKIIQEVQSFRETNRSSPLFNHLSAVSESVPALGWIAMVSGKGWPAMAVSVSVCSVSEGV